jgi:bifunctional ADP-heptose synthase (sugar kinase/adenylyltransferase)
MSRKVFDVTRAGDTLSPLYSGVCAGANLKDAAFIANEAAASRRRIGTAQVSKKAL